MKKTEDSPKDRLSKDQPTEIQASISEISGPKTTPIVSIGASAGGFNAVQELLSHLPADAGMALVLIQHLKPEHKSNLPELLAHSTSMKIHMATNNMEVKPGHLYILPPGQIMSIENYRLKLFPRKDQAGKFRPIDFFFEALGLQCTASAIAVVLSGSGADGSEGLRVVKEHGGIVLAQDEASAEFTEMPRHAVATGMVDFVLPPKRIAQKLAELCRHPYVRKRLSVRNAYANESELESFSAILQSLQGARADFTQYKQSTVRRRISRRMALHKIQSLAEYAVFLHKHPEEVVALKEDMLIKVTSFFRNPEVFEALRNEVFPDLVRKKNRDHPLRIWVPGCATGEEVYSLAMILLDFMTEKNLTFPVQIFGTDLSEAAIDKARRGVYGPNEIADLTEEQLQRHFVKMSTGYQIKKNLREWCVFARQDFTCDPPFSRLDMISCRNVLIYLEADLQKKVMPIFHYALVPDGILLLGSAESIGRFEGSFRCIDKKHRIYAKINASERLPIKFPPKLPTFSDSAPVVVRPSGDQLMEEVDLQKEAERILLQKYNPAAVVIDSAMNILYFRGNTGPFLEHLPGKASLNLLKMTRDFLRMDLHALIHKAQRDRIPQSKKHFRIATVEGFREISLEVTPFSPGLEEEYYLVQFELNPEDKPLTFEAKGEDEGKVRHEIECLKQALAASQDYTQSLIEEKEAALEELRAANEEILSSNEELQSINEELETAKEELESANEELVTVNQELQGRNEDLSRSNDDLQNLILSAEIPFVIVDQDLCIQRTSPLADKAFNVHTTDLGRSFSDIRLSLDVPDLKKLIGRVIDSAQNVEQEIVDQDGLWNLLRIRPYKTAGNQIRGAVITLIDIDRLKRSMDEIEKAHKYALRIVDTIKDPLMVLDGDLRVLTANPSFYEHFKVSTNETEGKLIYRLGGGQWDCRELRTLLEEILPKSPQMDNYLVRFDLPPLGQRSMLFSARKMSSVGKRSESILLAIEDVTQRLKMQEDLREATRRAEDASRAKSEFLATMSHEIRTPMTIVLGAVQQLLEEDLSQTQKRYLEMAQGSAEALTDLLSDILDFSRIEAQKLNLEHTPFNIRAVAENSINILRGDAQRKGLDLSLKVAETLPAILVGDLVRLRQVLVNLVGNAIKFTEKGSVAVQLDTSIDLFGREMVRFTVSDTGIGIPAEKMDHLFEMFRQIDASNTRKYGGTGLGLAICKGIVERMGGRIWATSEEGHGSVFSFTIPMITGDRKLIDEVAAKEQPAGQQKARKPIKPRRILIVEDDPSIQQLIKMFLDSRGWQSIFASDGKKALQYLQNEIFDLALMDLQMPGMDGLQLAKTIRDQERHTSGHLPLVALTAHAGEKHRESCLAAGMDDYLPKPFSKEALFEVIERNL